MSRMIITKNQTQGSLQAEINTFKTQPKKCNDDFHVNPSELAEIAGTTTDALLDALVCTVCFKFSTGNLYECKREGHTICENCFSLINPRNGCVFLTGMWKDTQCCSPYWTYQPSKAFSRLIESLKFQCLDSACKEIISPNAWKTHLETCPVLKEFIRCPDVLCKELSVAKQDFVAHCQEVHAVPMSTVREDGHIYFDLYPSKFDNGPAIALIMEHEGHILFIVGKNEGRRLIRLALFTTQRNAEWATRWRMELTKCRKSQRVFAKLKINPPERDWSDMDIFARSRYFLYNHLDDVFFDKVPASKWQDRYYRFELKIQDTTKVRPPVPRNSTWEDLPMKPEVKESRASSPPKQEDAKESLEDQPDNSSTDDSIVKGSCSKEITAFDFETEEFEEFEAAEIYEEFEAEEMYEEFEAEEMYEEFESEEMYEEFESVSDN